MPERRDIVRHRQVTSLKIALVGWAVLAGPKQPISPNIILLLWYAGIRYENIMLRIDYLVITDLFINFYMFASWQLY